MGTYLFLFMLLIRADVMIPVSETAIGAGLADS